MSLRPLLLAALLLVAAVPLASGASGLEFAATQSSATAQGTGDLQVAVGYTLSTDVARALRLTTRLEAGGQVFDHTAHWDLAGGHTTSGGTTAVTDSVSAGQHDVAVAYTVPAHVAAGSYQLVAFVRHEQTADDEGATLVPSAAASTSLTVTRSSGGGGGGNGGGSGGVALGAVTGLAATGVTATGMTVSWDIVAGSGVSYSVHRSTSAGFEPGPANQVATPLEPQATFTGLAPDTLYHVRVRAVDGSGAVGPISPELAVRTLAGADTVAPAAVPDLRLAKATSHSLALAWGVATDDRGPVSYEVHRGASGFTLMASTRVATTTALAYTDTSVQSAATYAYRVRAVDGSGNAGPASAELIARTLASAEDEGGAPSVQRIVLLASAGSWRMTWAADEPVTAALLTLGPVGQRTFDQGEAVSFSVDLGVLPEGLHSYTLTLTDVYGRPGTVSGQFRVAPDETGRFEALGRSQAETVTALVDAGTADLYWVDRDLDGRADAVEEAMGRITMAQPLPRRGAFLLEGPAGSVLAWTDGRVDTVQEVDAVVTGSSRSDAVLAVTVRVPDKAGWILAALLDPAPGLPLLGVERDDGTSVGEEAAWRSGGRVFFLDDPEATYRVLFDNAKVGTAGETSQGAGGWPAWATWILIGVGGMLAGMALMALVLRRRA